MNSLLQAHRSHLRFKILQEIAALRSRRPLRFAKAYHPKLFRDLQWLKNYTSLKQVQNDKMLLPKPALDIFEGKIHDCGLFQRIAIRLIAGKQLVEDVFHFGITKLLAAWNSGF